MEAATNEDSFCQYRIRAYAKSELARAYNPQIAPHSALNKLGRWIKYNRRLYAELLDTGYTDKQQGFTPRQVRLIFEYLGEP